MIKSTCNGKHWQLNLLAGVGFLLLASCMGAPEVLPDHFYRLADNLFDASKVISGSELTHVAVAQPKTNGIYQSRNLLYVSANQSLEVHRYNRYLWTAAPSQLIQEHMIGYLRNVLPGRKITEYRIGEPAEVLITMRLLRFEQVIEAQGSNVMVVMEMSWSVQGEADGQHNQRYTEHLPINPATPYAIAAGLSEALTGIYAALLKDIDSQQRSVRSTQKDPAKS